MKVRRLRPKHFDRNLSCPANVKAYRTGSTKWTYHKKQSFASNYFSFLKNYFSLRTSFKELIWSKHPSLHIPTFRGLQSFIWGFFFPVRILKFQWLKVNICMTLFKNLLRKSSILTIDQTLQIYFTERYFMERYFKAKYYLAGRNILIMVIYFPFIYKVIRCFLPLNPDNSQNE